MPPFRHCISVMLSTAAFVAAQDAELYVCNSNTVRSTAAHPITAQFYPYGPTCPPAYTAVGPGVLPGTRSWTYTPKLRYQAGGFGLNYVTVTGMIQTVRVGAAVPALPATNHYQMRMGIAPVQPVIGGTTYQMQHAAIGADILSIADAAAVVNTRPRFEISTTLTTPVNLGPTEFCFYLEFRGGEQQDDANNCQTTANDYYGGRGPSGGAFWGFTTGPLTGRTVTLNAGGLDFRPRVGLLIAEPVLTATGPHAYSYISGLSALEDSRGLQACIATWSFSAPPNNPALIFDVRAGSNYGSTGTAVVFLNLAPTWFAGVLPLPGFGNVLLNPADPAINAFAAFPMVLTTGGIFAGSTATPFPVPPLGGAAIGHFLKAQALVFNAGFTQTALSTASSILLQ